MTKRIFLVAIAAFIAIASGFAGYSYAMYRNGRVVNDLEYLNQANRISLSIQMIQLANSGNVEAIRSSQEQLIRLSVIVLKNFGIDSNGANKPIILESLNKLRDYQMKTLGRVDPDLGALLDRLR